MEVFISIYKFLFEVYNSRIKIFGFQKFSRNRLKVQAMACKFVMATLFNYKSR